MADINLGSTLAPGGPFAIVRDTDMFGGFRVVATTGARDAILASYKTVGMFVFVQANSTLYRLASIGPDVWTSAFSGGGSGPILSDANPADVDAGAAGPGGSIDAARADHKHSVTTGIAVNVADANAAGSGSAIALANHVHAHGSQTNPAHHALATTSTAGFMSAADKQALSSIGIGAVSEASWTVTPRFYAVDYDGGNDSNAGFSDVSMTAAGAVAKKTWEGLQAILPKFGNGRKVEINIKARAAGATYRNAANTADAVLDLRGYTNYSRFFVRGTGTVASANVTAFANNSADQIVMGGATPASLNAAGYKITKATGSVVSTTNGSPVIVEHDGAMVFVAGELITFTGNEKYLSAAVCWTVGNVIDSTHFSLSNSDGTTSDAFVSSNGDSIVRYKLTKADGSAAALGSESSTTLGLRLRGDVTNTNNPNAVRNIIAHSTDTIVVGALGSILANEIWYLEEPSVTFGQVLIGGSAGTDPTVQNVAQSFQIGGIKVVGSNGAFSWVVAAMSQSTRIVFCSTVGLTINNSYQITTASGWIQGTGAPVQNNTGGTFQVKGIASVTNVNDIQLVSAAFRN